MRIQLKIRKNTWEEWEVRYLVDGVEDEGKTYYTDDYDDAVQTKESIEKGIPYCIRTQALCCGDMDFCPCWNETEGWCEQDCLNEFYKEHGHDPD